MKDTTQQPKPSINQPKVEFDSLFEDMGLIFAPSPKDDKINFIPKK